MAKRLHKMTLQAEQKPLIYTKENRAIQEKIHRTILLLAAESES